MKITKKTLEKLIKEEIKNVLQEGLLEDPIDQSDSIILSALYSRGFRTAGFFEGLIASIKTAAMRSGASPNKIMEDELLKFRRGFDDIGDRIAGRLRSTFPAGFQSQAQRQDGSIETSDIPADLNEKREETEQLQETIKEELNNLLSEYTMVDDYFDLYESLQDAIDEDGNTPCPQCLYEMMVDADCGCPDVLSEAEYKGRKVKLNKRMRGDVKKFKVFVKGCGKDKSRVKKINFGDKNMKIKKNIPGRRKSFRARHKCHTAKDKCTARYWSCKAW